MAFGMASMAVVSPQEWVIGIVSCAITFGPVLFLVLICVWPAVKLLRVTGFMNGMMRSSKDPHTRLRLSEHSFWDSPSSIMIRVVYKVVFPYVVIFGLAML